MNNRSLKYSLSSLLMLVALLSFSACGVNVDETLQRIAKETRTACPQIIDSYTTMIDSEALPARTLKFTYSVKDTPAGAFDDGSEQRMKLVLIQQLKNRKELEFYLANDVRFQHVYLDVNKTPVLDIKIEVSDYK